MLVEILKQENVVGSWGLTEIRIGKREISFCISAFKYNGRIRIKCLNEGFTIVIGNETFKGIELSKVVELIDDKVEMTPDYFKDIAYWVGKKL